MEVEREREKVVVDEEIMTSESRKSGRRIDRKGLGRKKDEAFVDRRKTRSGRGGREGDQIG